MLLGFRAEMAGRQVTQRRYPATAVLVGLWPATAFYYIVAYQLTASAGSTSVRRLWRAVS